MPDPTPVLDRLAALASPDGGWGYQPGQPAHLEPTAFAVLALAADPARYGPHVEAGLRALAAHAAPDGSYRLTRGRPQAAWPTALVLFARAGLGHPPEQLAATADRL